MTSSLSSPSRVRRFGGRAVAVLMATTALVFGVAPAASAHVTVAPSNPAGGSYTLLTFKVPVESETAHTTALTVHLPEDTPFASVSAEPIPGWRLEVVKEELDVPLESHGNRLTEVVTSVTWTADGDGLAPGEFGRFTLSVGPLPESGTIYVPAEQAYSDGTVVSWVQQAEGGATPERPAPSFDIVSASGDSGGAQADDAHGTVDTDAAGEAVTAGPSTAWALALGAIGVALAALAAALSVLALRRAGH